MPHLVYKEVTYWQWQSRHTIFVYDCKTLYHIAEMSLVSGEHINQINYTTNIRALSIEFLYKFAIPVRRVHSPTKKFMQWDGIGNFRCWVNSNLSYFIGLLGSLRSTCVNSVLLGKRYLPYVAHVHTYMLGWCYSLNNWVFFRNLILSFIIIIRKYVISQWNWSKTINICSALLILMKWRFSTRPSVTTVLSTNPCLSSCLWVESNAKTREKISITFQYDQMNHQSSKAIVLALKWIRCCRRTYCNKSDFRAFKSWKP